MSLMYYLLGLPEPTDSWRVEQVLQWWLLRANAESEAEYDKVLTSLTQQVEGGKQTLWEAHKEVSEILNVDPDGPPASTNGTHQPQDPNTNNENIVPAEASLSSSHSMLPKQQQSSSRDMSAVMKEAGTDSVPASRQEESTQVSSTVITDSSLSSAIPNTVHIDVVAGDYQGKSYDVQPRKTVPCYVGRSQGKKFKLHGISLPKDLEVSTTHGRFEYDRGNFYYNDTGSTNGSRINNVLIEPNTPIHLTNGLLITAGQTTMKVTLTTMKVKEFI